MTVDLQSIPKNTCPLCRQPALVMEGETWTCEFCTCELIYDPHTRRARLSYVPKPYASVGEAVGNGWLSRREMFERADRADASGAAALSSAPPVGPLIVLVSSLMTVLVILTSIAAALVLSPSIERTRRSISAAYQPSPTPAPVAAGLGNPSPTATPEPVDTGEEPSSDVPDPQASLAQDTFQPTVEQPVPEPTPQPTLPPDSVSETPGATVFVPPPATLPPTFTPLPPAAPPAQVTLPPALVSPLPTPTPPVNAAQPEPPTPTPTPLPTTPPLSTTSTPTPQPAPVQIVGVRRDGTPGIGEADEFVEIVNRTTLPVLLGRWSIRVFNEVGQLTAQYVFSDSFVIQGGQRCRIYTNLTAGEDDCGLSGGFRSPVELLSPAGGRVVLLDPAGVEQQVYPF